ncbi:hypothetical protein [Caldinitratiruptor microaerophilus]|uniref:Uncharacterized protein n=1 Tax=Caldinitratiruptor microaerophilus TaxID=671077 RepID=A0AA35GAZ3_9FIRM|nr:hypothetical protein [Caldinitratiruptor microaerophilus]BDG61819.1 hypothetical protein caldi_29090 [Caldinitratiruptor microaerophilus]
MSARVWKERLLSLLLAAEVALSVALTVLAASASARAPLLAERARVAPPPPPGSEPDLLAPTRVWAHAPGGSYAVLGPQVPLFDRLWEALREATARTLDRSPFPEPVDPLQVETDPAEGFAGADLPVELPASAWAQFLVQGGSPGLGFVRGVSDAWDTPVQRVAVTLGEAGAVYLVGSGGALRFPLGPRAGDVLEPLVQAAGAGSYPAYRPLPVTPPRSPARDAGRPGPGRAPEERSVGEVPLAADPWVLVPVEPPYLLRRRYEARRPDPADLLPRLFPDPSVVQEIQETDATVYTDGGRALRLYRSGALEYTAPRQEDARGPRDPARALEAVRAFATPRGLWPAGARLSSFSAGEEVTRLVFTIPGPVLPTVSRTPLLEARVAGGTVVSFFRAPELIVREVGDEEHLIGPEAALAAVRAALADPQPRLFAFGLHEWRTGDPVGATVPVWVADFGSGRQVWVDARTGEVVLWTGRGPGRSSS